MDCVKYFHLFKFFNVNNDRHIGYPWKPEREYLVAIDNDLNIIGVPCYNPESLYRFSNKLCIGVGYISVAKEFKGHGIGKALVKALVEIAKRDNKDLRFNAYEPEGRKYLRHVVRRTAKTTDVNIYEESSLVTST